MSAMEKVTAALAANGSSKFGTNYHCPGPLHRNGDRKPSLHVDYTGNKVVLNCFTGCDTRDIADALGLEMKELFDETPSREVAKYDYHDIDGTLLYSKVRYEPKGFSVNHPSSTGTQPGIGGAKRVLYRMPQVLDAISAHKRIFIVEGEKDADRLVSLGHEATTNFEGAGKWRDEYTEVLEGAEIVIVADRDEAGYAHAYLLKQRLNGHAKSVRMVQSKTENHKDDISDHLDAGYSLDDLVSLGSNDSVARQYSPVNWYNVWKDASEEPEWLFEPILEVGPINALFGKPGVGKSLITLEIASTIARTGKPVVYIDDENRIQDTVERLKAYNCRPEELDRLFMYSFVGLPPLDTPDGGKHLSAIAERHDACLVILDTTSRMLEGDENSASTHLQFYRNSLIPLKGQGRTVLRLDHPGKDDTRGQRGSSAKDGDIDTLWWLSSESEDLLTLERKKTRSGHGESAIMVKRLQNPLRHDWDALESLPVTPEVLQWAEKLDRECIPRTTSRPALRTIMAEKNWACSNAVLSLVIRYRKKMAALDAVHGHVRTGGQEEIV